MTARPSESASAVSNDSARRNARSSRTRKRSTTTSIECFRFGSSAGGSSSSYSTPSILARTNPCDLEPSMIRACSPLRSPTIGASSMRRSPGVRAMTVSTISVTVCASSATPWSGQRGSPARAKSSRR